MAFFNPFDVITAGAGALPGTGVSDAAIRAGKVSAPAGSLAALGGGQAGPNGPGGAMAWMQPSPQPVPGMPPQQTPTMNPDILKRFMDPSFDPRMEPGFQDPRMPGAGIDPSTGQPMTQQDYDNTLKRYNELLPESQKYFRDFGPPDPNDPTRNEMNVLGQRLEAWQAMPGNAPVYQTMGGGEGPGGFTGQNQDPNFGQLSTVGAGPYGNRGSGQPISQPMGGYQAPGMATWTPAAGVPNGWQAGGIENPFGASGQQPLGSLQSLGGSIPGSPPMAANAGDWNGQGTMGGGFVSLRGPDGSMKQVPADQLSHWLSRGAVRA